MSISRRSSTPVLRRITRSKQVGGPGSMPGAWSWSAPLSRMVCAMAVLP
ncbi:MAG: hypothetical protein AAFV86_09065 [Pseudomonadota bacterium]